MEETIAEGKARIRIAQGKPSRKMPVFYNSEMRLNRDISVLLLKSLKRNHLKIADPLAASGIRSIRFLQELPARMLDHVFVNDISKQTTSNIAANLKLNKLKKRAEVHNEEANIFLLKNRPFDYIEIDPFGTPVYFLDAAVKSLARNAILAVTATDTAALSGTAPRACLRKYWAVPLKNYMMHEFGLRILIRRVQLAAASNGRALTPIYSYSKRHYMRVFFICSNKISNVDNVLKNHKVVSYCRNCFAVNVTELTHCLTCKSRDIKIAGPMWTASLYDPTLVMLIHKNASSDKFLKVISEESKINSLGFYDTHVFSEKLKLLAPKLERVISALKKRNFKAARTHLSSNGIRTNAGSLRFRNIIKKVH